MTIRAIVFTLLLTLLVSGCGGGSAPTGGTGDGSAAEATATVAESGGEPVLAGDAAAGQPLFATSCAACHGPDGRGVPNVGKDLVASDFVAAQSDAELLAFIKVGRDSSHPDNTTGIAMPPKGGNPALTDAQIADIVAWLRTVAE